MAARKLKWGIVSTAKIGLEKMVPAMIKAPHCEVVALASRDLGKAKAALAQLGLSHARAYGSYEELFADPEIDAIYNPLPNHLHVPITLAATKAGKHVLCEKPIGLDAADAERLRAIPKTLVVAEAFMVRYHPQWRRAREIVQSGELGEIRAVRCMFSYFNDDPTNVRNIADIGGGGIMDIGCYAVTGSRFLLEREPTRVVALVDRDPVFKTDRVASVIADFGAGLQMSFMCSTQLVQAQRMEVFGSKGRLEIPVPFNPGADARTALLVDTGAPFDGSLARREIIPAANQFVEELEAFALAALGGAPLAWGIDDAIQNMRIIDAIFASEVSGGWAQVGAAET